MNKNEKEKAEIELKKFKKEFDKLKITDVEIISVNDNSLDFEKVQNFYQNNKLEIGFY
jgi:hypothetical protein